LFKNKIDVINTDDIRFYTTAFISYNLLKPDGVCNNVIISIKNNLGKYEDPFGFDDYIKDGNFEKLGDRSVKKVEKIKGGRRRKTRILKYKRIPRIRRRSTRRKMYRRK
jgi:hypothetical protein